MDSLGTTPLTTAHSPLITIFKEFALTLNRVLSKLILPLLLLAGVLAAACGPAPEPTEPAAEDTSAATAGSEEAAAEPTRAPAGELITTASGLQYEILQAGDGPALQKGQIAEVHYVGMLDDGTVFDSSRERGEPYPFAVGGGGTIPGWEEGISLLHVGDQARLILPPALAYGETGAGGVIPPNATLTFEVEVLSVREGAPAAPTEVNDADYTTTESGLKYYDFVVGDGAQPQEGQIVVVHYTGWLEDGTMFDSSLNRGQPFQFPLGQGAVITGWDEGLSTMQVGGKRQLVLPPELGYGENSVGQIPPNSTLIFEVELVDILE